MLFIAALAAACRQAPPSTPAPPGAAPARPSVAPVATAQPVAAAQPVGGPTGSPGSPSPRGRALRDVMRPESRAAVDATTVPLLLPDDLALAATAVVTSGERWVAASIAQGDHTLAIHATRETMAAPTDPPVHRGRLRGVPATVSSNEGVRVATWMEGGVAYMIDVECTRPSEDPRCTQEGFIRALAERLVRVESAR